MRRSAGVAPSTRADAVRRRGQPERPGPLGGRRPRGGGGGRGGARLFPTPGASRGGAASAGPVSSPPRAPPPRRGEGFSRAGRIVWALLSNRPALPAVSRRVLLLWLGADP